MSPAMSRTELKQLIGVTDIVRVALGWGAFAALLLFHPVLEPPVPVPVLVIALGAIIVAILALIWALILLIRSIPSIIRVLRVDRALE